MRRKFHLTILFVFFGGFMLGATVFRTMAKYEAVNNPERGPEAFKAALGEYLVMKLDIPPRQMSELEPILNRSFEKLIEIRKQSLPAVQSLADETYEQAQPLLTPGQVEKAKALLSKVKSLG